MVGWFARLEGCITACTTLCIHAGSHLGSPPLITSTCTALWCDIGWWVGEVVPRVGKESGGGPQE